VPRRRSGSPAQPPVPARAAPGTGSTGGAATRPVHAGITSELDWPAASRSSWTGGRKAGISGAWERDVTAWCPCSSRDGIAFQAALVRVPVLSPRCPRGGFKPVEQSLAGHVCRGDWLGLIPTVR
jgi:hypothetical protein